jgi:peptidoglycan/LPS O-acetylase OafA/YrhL
MHHHNNFNFLRIVFAYFVLVTHSYALAGNIDNDFLYRITRQQICFSHIGVYGFFVLSGYLVYHSLINSNNIVQYLYKRCLRIFPALLVMLLVVCLTIILVFHNSIQYNAMASYIVSNLFLYQPQPSINNIFMANPAKSINGSLWTIPHEFTMYLLLPILYFINKNKKLTIALCAAVFIILWLGNVYYTHKLNRFVINLYLGSFVNFANYFVAGVLLALLNIEQWKHKTTILISTVVIYTIAIYYNQNDKTIYVLLPPIVVLLGLLYNSFLHKISNAIGDISYGVYIYAFPVQQFLMHFYALTALQLMLWSFIIVSRPSKTQFLIH